jgi:pimeloyl-ACP methyl ester carboxylesterase
VGSAFQGFSVSLSADGNTAIVGGYGDHNLDGAAWVWTRSGGVWSQQGTKLVGSGVAGNANQGFSVALSADGNTAIIGGVTDNGQDGAAWIWTRSGGAWTQQGAKLVGSGVVKTFVYQGWSVSLSADGNTAIVGGPWDNGQAGAAWIWNRSGGVWTQQGKLVGSGAVGTFVYQGWSVSLSTDGNTAIVGGPQDNNNPGAAWVWTRSGGVWTQQGTKLVGSSAGGVVANQGASVSLSADGNTAIVGGHWDNYDFILKTGVGAAWIWTRSGGVWTQQGTKLVGSGAIGNAEQGASVSLSADGKTVIVGGNRDNSDDGAAWVFAAPASGLPIPSLLGSATTPGAIATDGANLYIGSGNNVLSMPIAGGLATALYASATPCCVVAITQTGGNLFWIDPNGDPDATAIFRGPSGGGSKTKVYSGFATGQPIVDGSGLTTDGSRLYAVDEVSGNVVRMNLDGSGIATLGSRYAGGFSTEHLNRITVSDGMLYIADEGCTCPGGTIAPKIVRMPAGGGGFTTLFDAGTGFAIRPHDLAVAGSTIFFTDSINNTIWKMPTSGGTPSALIAGAPFSRVDGITALGDALYVTDSGAGRIYKISLSQAAGQVVKRRAVAPPGNAPLESATQRIVAAVGGMITLPSGSSVTIPAGVLSSDQTVLLSLMPALPKLPPSGNITGVGPALVLTFTSTVTPPPTTQAIGINFVIKYGSNAPPSFKGSAPLADVVDEDNFLGGIPISCDSTSACFTIPLSVMQNTQSIAVASANLRPYTTLAPPAPLGPRIWNGSTWVDFPDGFCPTKKTLVLIHGLFSSVEGAFGPCLTGIKAGGHYDQVIGFNYDWTQRIVVGGQKFADFLTQLNQSGLTRIDIEAHSYGTVTALYAASLANIEIDNMVLEGAPLQGSPVDSWLLDLPKRDWLMTILANANFSDNRYVTAQTFEDVLNSGMWLDLRPGNPLLDGIARNALTKHPGTNYIKVAGTKSFLPPIVDGYLFRGEPNDGLMTSLSASDSGFNEVRLPGPSFIVPNTHTQLECASEVISRVAGALTVQAGPPTVSFAASPTMIAPGQSSTLMWTTTNATSVSISNVGPTQPEWCGSVSVSPAVTTTYTLTATGPGGTATAMATVTVNGVSSFTITVARTGTGSGTVTSSPSGIACGATCIASFASGASLTLSASPANGSTFGGWSGACAGTSTTCTLTMNANKSVTAAFNTSPSYTLTTSTAGSGSGVISPSSGSYPGGTVVTLTATAASGSTFGGWSGGGCSGTGSCTITMNSNMTVIAIFNLSGSNYTYANWNCNNQSQCIAVMGHNVGSAGPFCSPTACDAWRKAFFTGATCTAQPMYPIYSAPPPGTCSNYPN